MIITLDPATLKTEEVLSSCLTMIVLATFTGQCEMRKQAFPSGIHLSSYREN